MPSSDTQGPGPSTDHNSAGTRQVPQAPGHALGSPFPHYFSTSYFWPVSQGPCLTPTPSPPADDLISSLQKNRGYLAGIPSKFLHTPLFLCRLPLISQHLAPPLPSVVTGQGILSAIWCSPSTCSQTPSPPIIASLLPLSLSLSSRGFLFYFLHSPSEPSSWSPSSTLAVSRICFFFKHPLLVCCHTVALARLSQRSLKPLKPPNPVGTWHSLPGSPNFSSVDHASFWTSLLPPKGVIASLWFSRYPRHSFWSSLWLLSPICLLSKAGCSEGFCLRLCFHDLNNGAFLTTSASCLDFSELSTQIHSCLIDISNPFPFMYNFKFTGMKFIIAAYEKSHLCIYTSSCSWY